MKEERKERNYCKELGRPRTKSIVQQWIMVSLRKLCLLCLQFEPCPLLLPWQVSMVIIAIQNVALL